MSNPAPHSQAQPSYEALLDAVAEHARLLARAQVACLSLRHLPANTAFRVSLSADSESRSRQALRTELATILEQPLTDPFYFQSRHDWLFVPIFDAAQEPVGLIGVAAKSDGAFTENDERLLGQIAGVIGHLLSFMEFRESSLADRTSYQDITETISQIVWMQSPNGTLEYLNSRWHEYTGSTLAETNKRGIASFSPSDDHARLAAAWDRANQTGETYRQEVRLKGKDGTYCWFLSVGIPIKDKSGAISRWVGTYADIHAQKQTEQTQRALADENARLYRAMSTEVTERREIEVRLREREERLRQAIDAGQMSLWEWDLKSDVILWEGCPQDLFGTASIDPLAASHDFFKAIFEEDRTFVAATLQRAGEHGSEFNLEFRVRWPDDTLRWIAMKGKALIGETGRRERLTGVCFDITQRKRLETELNVVYQKEHRIAEALQRSMLQPLDEILFPGLLVKTAYQAAWDEAQVGGDYYDVFAIDEGNRIALIVGDAAGKGLRAAGRIAEVKFALRAFLREDPSPARSLKRLNFFLLDAQHRTNQTMDNMVCLSLAVVDTLSARAVFSAAGADAPLLLRADGSAESTLASGIPIGIEIEAEYTDIVMTLERGDTILFATDGITEARRGKEFLGYEGMTALARQTVGQGSLQAISQAILDGAQEFSGGRLKDDACLLLARLEK